MNTITFKKIVNLMLAASAFMALQPSLALTPHSGGFIDLEGFYTRPNDSLLSGLPYAWTDLDSDALMPSYQRFQHIRFDSNWAGHIAVGYDVCNSCCSTNGLSLEYTGFWHDRHQRVYAVAPGTTFPEIADNSYLSALYFTAGATAFSDAEIRNDVNYHTVDLLGHRKMEICCSYLDIFAGARYLYLDEKLDANYHVNPALVDDFDIFNTSEVINYKTEVNAVGPHIGAKAFYPIYRCFGVSGQLAGSLLYSYTMSRYHDQLNDPRQNGGRGKQFYFDNRFDHPCHIVPAVSGKIALAYSASFGNSCNCHTILIEAGYRGDKYFDLVDHLSLIQSAGYQAPFSAGSESHIENGSRARSYNQDARYHDFDVMGPFVSITLHA